MIAAEDLSEKSKHIEKSGPLIGGLPDDIALLCLAMVPRRYHHILRCVSKRWRALLSSEEWLSCRKKYNLVETWIYVMCRDKFKGNCYFVLDPDPAKRCWVPLHNVPIQCLKKEGISFEASGERLYLLGGCSWQKDATDEVYCYDARANKWEMAAPMPMARCYFASAVLNKRIYVAGGIGINSTMNSWDIYDPCSNSWNSEGDPTGLGPDIVKFIPLDSKIYTIHKSWNDLHQAGLYDPTLGSWNGLDHDIKLCRRGPTVAIDGTLYMLDETLGTRLMMWQEETKDWVALGRLSDQFTRPPCQLVAIRRTIFLIGQGLSTMVIDVDKATKLGGILVSSSIVPKLEPDFCIISCKTVAI